MRTKPKVSICVPVYNSASFLAAFLDSALQQTFEDYEIVATENHSTDHSLRILREYEAMFPDKISVYQTDEHGWPGKGRNISIQKSSGDYIYLCDSDDLLHPRALEVLYAEAVEYDADLVCGHGFRVDVEDGEIQRFSKLAEKRSMAVSNETAIISGAEFWLRLIKKSLIEKVGPMPEDILFDDIRYIPVLHSHANTIRFLNFPVYYWFKRGSSTTSDITKEVCTDSIDAEQYLLAHSNPEHLVAVQYHLAVRNKAGLTIRWPFFDLFVNQIREEGAWFYDNELIKKNRRLFDALRWAEGLADRELPNIIYVNGFGVSPAAERIEHLQEKVFHDGCEIVILSPQTCDVNENEYIKKAYDEGNWDLLSGYFALKKIYESGGIFLHENIKILNYFGFLKYQNAFFSLIDKTTYSEWIFGGPAGSEAIAAILKTYSRSWDKKEKFMPLSERISIILTAKYGIPMDGRARLFQKTVSVLPPDLSVADTRFGNPERKCAFEHDFSAYAGDDGYITLPRTALRALMYPSRPAAQKSNREKALERELADLKRSNTWKMMMKIREIGDGPMGPFLKKIYRTMMKIRAKFKKK